jgi:uncharacterized membrane protein (DUF2068 family)
MALARAVLKPAKARESTKTLLVIALFKLAKSVLLIAVGIGALKLLHRDVAEVVEHWVNLLRVDPDNRFVHGVLARILGVSPNQLKALSAGTFVYAGLLLTEGTGLMLRKRWAEYFTIITTAALIPIEVYETSKHFTLIKVGCGTQPRRCSRHVRGPEKGLRLIDDLLERGELVNYHLAHSARAELCRRLGRIPEARTSYEKALSLVRQEPERRFLAGRLRELK